MENYFSLYLSNNKVIVTDYKSATSGVIRRTDVAKGAERILPHQSGCCNTSNVAELMKHVFLIFLLCLSNNKVIFTDYKSATSGLQIRDIGGNSHGLQIRDIGEFASELMKLVF